jgi:hypothetical protein
MNKHDKKDHFTEQFAKMKDFVPDAKYNVLRDWSKDVMCATTVDKLRHTFRPGKRVSFTEQVMN